MIEIYSTPTAQSQSYSATLRRMVDNRLEVAGQSIPTIVFYETQGMLETNKLGTLYKAQIAQSDVADTPRDAFLTIDGKDYKVTAAKIVKNPLFLPYWQCELKSQKLPA